VRSLRIAFLSAFILTGAIVVAGSPPAAANKTAGSRYTAYYFHGKFRCPTCLKIEKLSAESLKTNQADMIRQGVLTWRAVNTDLPENAHFNKDFALSASALVFVCEEGGQTKRFRVVDEVWEWVGGPEADFARNVDEAFDRFVTLRK
jgi:hypothetical protein